MAATSHPTGSSPPPGSAGAGTAEGPTVLVVDDALIDRMMAGGIVGRALGGKVVYAENGTAALAAIEQEKPGVVLTDLQMPEMDGLELVEAVRVRHPLLPVVLMTAHGSEEIALQALRLGASSYVPKKYLDRDLPDILSRVLQSAKSVGRRQAVLEDMVRMDAEFRLRNEPALVPPLIALLQEMLAGMKICDDHGRLRVAVALEEALLNACYHGNLEVSSDLFRRGPDAFHRLAEERRRQSPYRERRVHVRVHYSPSEARFEVEDEGPGFDPSTLPDPTDPANLEKPSGRGILLIRSFMDEVHHNPRGNLITLIKRARLFGEVPGAFRRG